jgi:hypothetical protein
VGVAGGSSNIGVNGVGGYAGVYASTQAASGTYGLYATNLVHGNTGYAGYFINTDTSDNINFGVYGLCV